MKIKNPGSPLAGGAQPLESLDPRDSVSTVKAERFSAALAQMEAQTTGAKGTHNSARAALGKIANNSDLSTNEGALSAVRASARFMVSSRLKDRHRESPEGEQVAEEISEFVSTDPLLRSKMLSILHRVKDQ